jgi:hypothetical protein
LVIFSPNIKYISRVKDFYKLKGNMYALCNKKDSGKFFLMNSSLPDNDNFSFRNPTIITNGEVETTYLIVSTRNSKLPRYNNLYLKISL